MGKFKSFFRKVHDPRAANAQYELLSILTIALAAVLCGAKSATDMADFAKRRQDLLRQFLPLPKRTPSRDTFSDLFRALDPHGFEQVFRRFVTAFARFHRLDLDGVIAIDGKSLRGAYERGQSATPIHLVNAFAAKARLALAVRKAPGRKELDAALEILQMLRLKRKTVTADALFCSRSFARTVLDQGGHYVLALKRNQGKLYDSVASRFAHTGERDTARERLDASHDRRERRHAAVMRDTSLAGKHNFPGIAAIGRITCWRQRKGVAADKPSYATSCSPSTSRPGDCLPSRARTGRSRTRCTGCSMSIWRKMPIAPGKTPRPRTSAYCAGWRSIFCTRIPPRCPSDAR